MDIRLLLAYADNARRLLHETLNAHPDALTREFDTLSQYNSIPKQVAHLVGAEQRWTVQRLYDEPRPPRYEDAPGETLEGLFADWDAIRARTRAFVEAADAAALGRVITYTLPNWGNYTDQLTAEDILFHICNHQTYHLSQISMFLQMQQIDPPNFDYVLLHQRT